MAVFTHNPYDPVPVFRQWTTTSTMEEDGHVGTEPWLLAQYRRVSEHERHIRGILAHTCGRSDTASLDLAAWHAAGVAGVAANVLEQAPPTLVRPVEHPHVRVVVQYNVQQQLLQHGKYDESELGTRTWWWNRLRNARIQVVVLGAHLSGGCLTDDIALGMRRLQDDTYAGQQEGMRFRDDPHLLGQMRYFEQTWFNNRSSTAAGTNATSPRHEHFLDHGRDDPLTQPPPSSSTEEGEDEKKMQKLPRGLPGVCWDHILAYTPHPAALLATCKGLYRRRTDLTVLVHSLNGPTVARAVVERWPNLRHITLRVQLPIAPEDYQTLMDAVAHRLLDHGAYPAHAGVRLCLSWAPRAPPPLRADGGGGSTIIGGIPPTAHRIGGAVHLTKTAETLAHADSPQHVHRLDLCVPTMGLSHTILSYVARAVVRRVHTVVLDMRDNLAHPSLAAEVLGSLTDDTSAQCRRLALWTGVQPFPPSTQMINKDDDDDDAVVVLDLVISERQVDVLASPALTQAVDRFLWRQPAHNGVRLRLSLLHPCEREESLLPSLIDPLVSRVSSTAGLRRCEVQLWRVLPSLRGATRLVRGWWGREAPGTVVLDDWSLCVQEVPLEHRLPDLLGGDRGAPTFWRTVGALPWRKRAERLTLRVAAHAPSWSNKHHRLATEIGEAVWFDVGRALTALTGRHLRLTVLPSPDTLSQAGALLAGLALPPAVVVLNMNGGGGALDRVDVDISGGVVVGGGSRRGGTAASGWTIQMGAPGMMEMARALTDLFFETRRQSVRVRLPRLTPKQLLFLLDTMLPLARHKGAPDDDNDNDEDDFADSVLDVRSARRSALGPSRSPPSTVDQAVLETCAALRLLHPRLTVLWDM